MNQIERTRNEYRPADIRVLFVGESPPAKGGFFYFGGGGFSGHTKRAFEIALGRRFESDAEFFRTFQEIGCWLDDVSQLPVDHMEPKERKAMLEDNIPRLAVRIREASPKVIVVMLKRIKVHVAKAMDESGIRPEVHFLPFPGFGNQNRFKEELVPILRKARASGVLIRNQCA